MYHVIDPDIFAKVILSAQKEAPARLRYLTEEGEVEKFDVFPVYGEGVPAAGLSKHVFFGVRVRHLHSGQTVGPT